MTKDTHRPPPNVANRNIRVRDGGASGDLTELEGVILGIVWSRQPCSSYAVLSRFQRSPTWGWSSSTGAIYPAIRRMRLRGLLQHHSTSVGKRRSESLSLTTEGQTALRSWISNLSEEMGSAGLDPIRTRVNYLAALEPSARSMFLDRAEQVTRSRLELAKASRADPDAKQNWTLEATSTGLVYQLEARLDWIRDLRQLIAAHGCE